MPRGGPRQNSGGARTGAERKKGVPNRLSQQNIGYAESTGQTPLEFLLMVMHDEKEMPDRRLSAAKIATPYVHPKLTSIKFSGMEFKSHEEWLKDLGEGPWPEYSPAPPGLGWLT